MAKVKHTPVCSICSHLPREKSVEEMSDFDKAAGKLGLPEPTEKWHTQVYRCPECGNYYEYTCNIDTEEQAEHTYIHLERLAPAKTLEALKGKEKKAYEKALPALLERLKADLDHPVEFMRSEATWALSQYYLNRCCWAEIEGLMGHKHPVVRREAFRTMMNCSLDGKPCDRFLPVFEAGLKDKDDDVRYYAAYALAGRYLELEAPDQFEAMLASKDTQFVTAAVGQLRGEVEHHYLDASRFEGLLSKLRDHENKFVRETSYWILGRMERNRREGIKVTKLSKTSYLVNSDKKSKPGIAETVSVHGGKSTGESRSLTARPSPDLPDTITNSIGKKMKRIQSLGDYTEAFKRKLENYNYADKFEEFLEAIRSSCLSNGEHPIEISKESANVLIQLGIGWPHLEDEGRRIADELIDMDINKNKDSIKKILIKYPLRLIQLFLETAKTSEENYCLSYPGILQDITEMQEPYYLTQFVRNKRIRPLIIGLADDLTKERFAIKYSDSFISFPKRIAELISNYLSNNLINLNDCENKLEHIRILTRLLWKKPIRSISELEDDGLTSEKLEAYLLNAKNNKYISPLSKKGPAFLLFDEGGYKTTVIYPLFEDLIDTILISQKSIEKENEPSKTSYLVKSDKKSKPGIAETVSVHGSKSTGKSRSLRARSSPDLPDTITNSIGMKLKLVQSGEFTMGGQWNGDDSLPPHRVRITRQFYLGVYPVTQREWAKVMGASPSNFKGEDLPVESVSWEDCQAFISKLNAMEPGADYRLPTEAEWEYACRAGSTERFCFGVEKTLLGEYAWYSMNSGDKTHPVGEKKPNAWGLYDMHGNVWEWCWDWYDDIYYKVCAKLGVVADPSGPKAGPRHVFRGASWDDASPGCTSGHRGGVSDVRCDSRGLRLAMSI